jgi:hypothetical protein
MLAAALAAGVALLATRPASAQQPQAVERPIAFDGAGRVLVLTPPVAARWKLAAPDWPLGNDWKEARLYQLNGSAVLVAQLVNGDVARYAYTADALTRLRAQVDAAVVAQGTGGGRGETGLEMSQPAGNAFVRNQVLLGLFAYGPATAALLSNSGGAAAGGGYLLAAGSSYFVASQMIRTRTVTRAQASLASHGGTRGGLAGAGIAAIANADGGPGYGAPILAGAIGGTVAGFVRARPMSDGEAAASGLAADLAAITAFGVNGIFGAFDEKEERIPEPGAPYVEQNDNLEARAKVAIGSAIGAGLVGYAIGPRYARRASYNVTAGDVSMVYSGATLGVLAAVSTLPDDVDERVGFAATTAGVLGGAFLADRFLVRRADRTSGDGTLAQLGAVAGGLLGGGIALLSRAERQVAMALIASGGTAGLVLADRSTDPAPDAGPVGGVLTTGARAPRHDARLSLSVVQAATTLGVGLMQPANGREVRAPIGRLTF